MSMEKDDLFDPGTGETLGKKNGESIAQEAGEAVRFDPETGEPIARESGEADRFDPETGEPIAQESGETDRFDPETGKPIVREAGEADRFDPETGEPIARESGAPDRFDPETGEPIVREAGAPDRFDPETGKPIARESGEADRFDPETGEPIVREAGAPDRFDPETGEPIAREVGAPDLFDPETGEPLGRSGKLAKRPQKKKAIFIAAAAVCACAAVGVLAVGGGLFKKPKDIVADALTEIVNTADQGFLEDTFGIRELRKQAVSGSVRMGGSVEVEELPMLGTLGSGNGTLEFCRDTGKKAVQLTGTAEIANMDLGSLIVYMDDQQIAASVPEFLDQTFVLNYADHLEEQIDGSYLASLLGMEAEDAEMAAYFMSDTNQVLTGQKERFQLKEIYERYKETTKAAENLKNSLEIEKTESKNFKTGGKEQKCKGYQVTIPKEAIADFIKPMGKFIASDEELKNNEIAYVTEILTFGYMMDGSDHDEAGDRAESDVSRLLEMLKDGSDEAETFIKDYMDDIEMVLYVDNRGHAVYLEMETSLDLGRRYSIKGDFTFDGGKAPAKNMEGSMRISSKGESMTFSIEKAEKEEKDQYTGELTLRVSENGESVKVAIESNYNKKDGDFEAKVSGSSGVVRFTAGMEGTVTDYKKGKSIEVKVDSVNVKGPGISLDMDFLSGSFFIEPLSGKLAVPEGEVFDIISADESDWEAVGDDLESEMQDLYGFFYSY